ncbi:hypothetical protein MBCUT_03440 [Methanobrevibacter cuticularis]|uniref:Bacterial Ig-like domain protein n=1 Tax=Methanobrevibacter cuticularis TaxID=47311 RepID=A0A166EXC7_9EURY|nr:hypothetical protein [Methanobrevibacter cuticularis]KZX17112.1 hypothetical protein MBCUT_03440 [Methanobrevibacter cuticularis]
MKRNNKTLKAFLIIVSIVMIIASVSAISATKTYIKVDPIENTSLGGGVNIKATIYDEDGNVLSGKMIDFSINGEHCNGHEFSNQFGSSYLFQVANKVGLNTVLVSYNSTDEYESSSTTATFYVSDPKANNEAKDSPKEVETATPKTGTEKIAVLNVKNSYSTKKGKIILKSILSNVGQKEGKFKISYKLPKGLTYKKPVVSKGILIKYDKKKRIVTLIVNKLKVKSPLSIKFTLNAKKGKYSINPTIIKSTGLKIKSNNKLPKIKVK